jgi:hypothetical protein
LFLNKIFAVFKSRWINRASLMAIYPIRIFLNNYIAYEFDSFSFINIK